MFSSHFPTFLIFSLILPPLFPARQTPPIPYVNSMSEIKKYLHRFGYMPVQDANLTDAFAASLANAVARYQATLGLPVSGKLDSGTLSEIMLPRCGVPDTSPEGGRYETRHFAYLAGRPRWARATPMTLTYGFSPENSITSLSFSDIQGAFQRAFSRWSSVIPVTFVETGDYGFADIKIGFYGGDHGDGEPFDGELGILAHAFSPESGRFHLDAAETWAVDFGEEKSVVAVDLESVATHEIGHLLGLAHTSVREAIMYPSLKPRQRKLDLKGDDIKAIQALYGSNPDFTFAGSLESDISSNQAADWRDGSWTWLTILPIFVQLLHV